MLIGFHIVSVLELLPFDLLHSELSVLSISGLDFVASKICNENKKYFSIRILPFSSLNLKNFVCQNIYFLFFCSVSFSV